MTRHLVLAAYGWEIERYSHLAPHFAAMGLAVTVWTSTVEDADLARGMQAFDEVVYLFEGFEGSAGPTEQELSREASALEARFEAPFLHRDAAADRNITGITGSDVDAEAKALRRHWEWREVEALAVHLVRAVERELKNHSIVGILGETNKLWTRLIYRVATSYDIPYLTPLSLPHANERLMLLDSLEFHWPACIATLEQLRTAPIPPEVQAEASALLAAIRNDRRGAEQLALLPRGTPTMRGKLKVDKLRKVVTAWRRSVGGRENIRLVARRAETLTLRRRLQAFLATYRNTRFYERTAHRSVPDVQYCIYFLHVTPEWTVETLAFDYQDQIATIRSIVARLPTSHVLLVKEHPHSAGRRSLSFYAELATIPGVYLVRDDVNSADLMEKAEAVITLTGTVALESVCIGTPAIVLGDMYYRYLPGITHVEHIEDIAALLSGTPGLRRPTPDDGFRILAARIMAAGPARYPGDPNDDANNRMLARAIGDRMSQLTSDNGSVRPS